jgi:hypothetical protein
MITHLLALPDRATLLNANISAKSLPTLKAGLVLPVGAVEVAEKGFRIVRAHDLIMLREQQCMR